MERSAARGDCRSFSALRVLVLGDAAVGKTALIENICSVSQRGKSEEGAAGERPQAKGEWTCGCSVSVARETVEVDLRPREVEVEFWEVGGTQTYALARPVFYDSFDAALLVYDVSNAKSYHNLVSWLLELCTCSVLPSLRYWDTGGGSGGVPEADIEGGAVGAGGLARQALLTGLCPVLFVAHKCDLEPTQAARQRKQGGVAPVLSRPEPPKQPALLDRILGGGEAAPGASKWFGRYDPILADKLCTLVQRGCHTEATSKEDCQSFDPVLWRDFIRRTLEARQGR